MIDPLGDGPDPGEAAAWALAFLLLLSVVAVKNRRALRAEAEGLRDALGMRPSPPPPPWVWDYMPSGLPVPYRYAPSYSSWYLDRKLRPNTSQPGPEKGATGSP